MKKLFAAGEILKSIGKLRQRAAVASLPITG
jgi:hypothetical protein